MTINRSPALGDRVRDRVTGLEGIVTAHSKHIAGCDRLWMSPRVGSDGKQVEGQWIDIDLVEILETSVIAPVSYERLSPGGTNLPPSR